MIGQNSQEYAKSHTLVLLAWLTLALATTTAAPAFAQTSGTWTTTGRMSTARIKHSATVLQNGQVLAAGGVNPTGSSPALSCMTPAPGSG